MKGGSQEVAAIVANLNQPDFGETFINWLNSVHKYPRAFDFKYESIVSILDLNVRTLFASTADKEQKICSDFMKTNCKFGFTVEEFEENWRKKLKALQFAITIYLKEPNGLTLNKFFIEKGTSECRFNILNYLPPFWKEITSGDQEFHITVNFNSDEEPRSNSVLNEFLFKKNDDVYFMKRDDFWLAKRKGDIYTYQSAKLLNEPFKSFNSSYFINIFGLIIEYNERDATVSVVNISHVLTKYSNFTNCNFRTKLNNSTNLIKIEYLEDQTLQLNATNTSIEFEWKQFEEHRKKCLNWHKIILINLRYVKNLSLFWIKLWDKVIGVVDYVDPIKAVIRTWDLKFAVMPCQLKWSNNLMMVLPKNENDGKCLKFIAATEGELFVVVASTPGNQSTWYTFQITTKGVIFYRVSKQIFSQSERLYKV